MKYSLGSYLKELRQERGFIQKQIIKPGLLSQSQLSKIENGDELPKLDQLSHLARIYHFSLVEIEPYLEEGFNLDHNQQVNKKQTILEIRKCVQFYQYDKLGTLVLDARKQPYFQDPFSQQFLDWHMAIYEHQHLKDMEKSIQTINQAIRSSVSSIYRERFVEILNSKGAFYISQNLYEKALPSLSLGIKIVHSLRNLSDYRIQLRLFFNLSSVYFHLKDFAKSLDYTIQAKEVLFHHDSSYLRDEINIQYRLAQAELKKLDGTLIRETQSSESFDQGSNFSYSSKKMIDYQL